MQNGEITVTLPTPVWLGGVQVDNFNVDVVNGHAFNINIHYTGLGVRPEYESDKFCALFVAMLNNLAADLQAELRDLDMTIGWAETSDQIYIESWDEDSIEYNTDPEMQYAVLCTGCSDPREGEYFAALPGAICATDPG